MEIVRIAVADDQESHARVGAERHERGRGQGVGVALEQVLLPVAERTAARLRRAQKPCERPDCGIFRGPPPHEARALGRGRHLVAEQHEHRALRAEVFAEPGLEPLEPRGQTARAHELESELMNLLGERVVRLRDRDEVLELTLELRVALAQHRHLPLDERHRGAAGAMRQLQAQEDQRVPFEEVGMALQVIGDRAFRKLVAVRRADRRPALLLAHSSICPSYATLTGPVCHSVEPGPRQLTSSVPPGRLTSTRSASSPHRRPTATAAAAPVPPPSVPPAPRSNTRSLMWRSSTRCMKPTLTRCGKLGCRSSTGPSIPTGARATESTSITTCGLPIDTAPNSTLCVGSSKR